MTLDATLAQARAEQISAELLIDVTPLASNAGFVARFTSDQGLRCYAQTLIQHGDKSVGIVIKPDGTIPREAEARLIIMPHLALREEITVAVQMIYDCNADDPKAVQSQLIEDDLNRLLTPASGTTVECVATTITHVAAEAETYGTEEGRSLAERQADRLTAALGGIAYPDDAGDPQALLKNALCDLRHFADQNGLAFAQADRAAQQIYTSEKTT